MKDVKVHVQDSYNPESDNINLFFDETPICLKLDGTSCIKSHKPCPHLKEMERGIINDCIEY